MPSHKEIDPRIATLVRVDGTIRNHSNPRVNFAMSDSLLAIYHDQRDQLVRELGLSNDKTKRTRQIAGYKGFMKRNNYPFWRVNGAIETSNNGNRNHVFLQEKTPVLVGVKT